MLQSCLYEDYVWVSLGNAMKAKQSKANGASAELWGGSRQRVRPVQTVVISGLRHLVRCGLDCKLPVIAAVHREPHRPLVERRMNACTVS